MEDDWTAGDVLVLFCSLPHLEECQRPCHGCSFPIGDNKDGGVPSTVCWVTWTCWLQGQGVVGVEARDGVGSLPPSLPGTPQSPNRSPQVPMSPWGLIWKSVFSFVYSHRNFCMTVSAIQRVSYSPKLGDVVVYSEISTEWNVGQSWHSWGGGGGGGREWSSGVMWKMWAATP